MIDAHTLPLGEPIYTFVSKDGENINIHVPSIRRKVTTNPAFDAQRTSIPVTWNIVSDILKANAASLSRCKELLNRYLKNPSAFEPIILCAWADENGGMLVDGHHRYCIAYKLQLPFIPGYVLPYSFWQQFRISGLPDISAEGLRRMPVTKRNY